LRHRVFAGLWIGVLFSTLGTWMQTLGAQWLLVDTPNAATVVALVQVAMTLPMMLLALPAGVLADVFDRRWLLFAVQVYLTLLAALLWVLTVTDRMTPWLLLAFTFLLGVGGAVQIPAWQASTSELVPRHQIRAAAQLEMVAINLSRAAGPALAGVVIANVGVSAVFGMNVLAAVPMAVALLLWRREPTLTPGGRERFWPALRAGGRYVWHDADSRRILARLAAYLLPAAALWALLPLAARRFGVGADGYGLLFAALGVGAITGALMLGRVRRVTSTTTTLTVAGTVMALALVLLVTVPVFAAAVVVAVAAGVSWTATISTLIAELRLFLPAWVMGRGMAVYTMVFTGCQAVGALLWGLVAGWWGLTATYVVCAALSMVAVVAGLVWRVADAGEHAPDPVVYWAEARVSGTPDPDAGPVMVTVHYTVAAGDQPAWLAAMRTLRRSRLRTGAIRWELYRDAEHPDRFVEQFRVGSWQEHLRQHEGRLTALDREVEETAMRYSDPPATAVHLLPP
jgi:MFS family permease